MNIHFCRQRMHLRKRAKLLSAAILLLLTITLCLIFSYYHYNSTVSEITSKTETALEILEWEPYTPPRIAIAGTSSPNTNNRSLTLWSAYATRHGYEIHVQRNPVVRGFASPLIWLQHAMVVELSKETNDKADWIVYINPSHILPFNHQIPLTHFLPPPSFPTLSTLTFIGTESSDIDISTSIFYLRVSSLSLRMLTLAMATVYLDSKRNWDEEGAGAALRDVLEREGYRDKVVWVPEAWWDGDGKGAGFVKMDGLGLLEREKVLEEVEERMSEVKGEVAPSEKEVEAFWGLVGEARAVLDKAKKREFKKEMKELRDVVELRTWDIGALMVAMEKLKERLGLGEFNGYEAQIE